MRWLRHNRHVALVALGALALQVAFSFGHIHSARDHVDSQIVTALKALANSQRHAEHRHHHHDHAHGSHHGHHVGEHGVPAHEDDHEAPECPMCWTTAIAGALAAASGPCLPNPLSFSDAYWSGTRTARVGEVPRHTYGARAPPILLPA